MLNIKNKAQYKQLCFTFASLDKTLLTPKYHSKSSHSTRVLLHAMMLTILGSKKPAVAG
jgi:hypothetical protein